MKLATYNNNTRDGQLIVVKKDLSEAVIASDIANTLQDALDKWEDCSPKLIALSQALNAGTIKNTIPFKPSQVTSPLPRAYQWADGSAYVNHVELVRKARGAKMPESFWKDPLMYQGGSDRFIGPLDPIIVANESYGIDFEAEIAVITDDVPMGISTQLAEHHIKLIMLVNDVSLRQLIPAELAKGFGFFQSKPASSFSPVAVTPDELDSHWHDCKIHLALHCYLNQELFGQANAGEDMTFNFAELIAHAAKTRDLGAGTIIGSGTVSNYNRNLGSSCIQEKRMLETIAHGEPKTDFMHFGDRIKIQMLDDNGINIFGSIDQEVIPYS